MRLSKELCDTRKFERSASEHSGNIMYHFLYFQKPILATNCVYMFHMILIVNSEYFSEED